MIKFVVLRLLQTLPVLLGISFISFAVMHVTPGDPAEIMLRAGGVQPSPEAVAAARAELGFDKPFYVQYGQWLWRVLHLDMGVSVSSGRPVIDELLGRLPATLLLAAGQSSYFC